MRNETGSLVMACYPLLPEEIPVGNQIIEVGDGAIISTADSPVAEAMHQAGYREHRVTLQEHEFLNMFPPTG